MDAVHNIIVSTLVSAIIPFSQMNATPAASTAPTQVESQSTAATTTTTWVVQYGETARSIAAEYYGSQDYWTTIVNDNDWITDPNNLPPHAIVALRKDHPDKPDELKHESAQPTPAEIKPTVAPQVTPQPASTPSGNDRYSYVMSHTSSYGGLTWNMPLLSFKYISTYFSWYHPGIDMPTTYGSPVYAATDGTVSEAGWSNEGYGNTIVVTHANGYWTRYAHLSAISVKTGQSVSRGSQIGAVGCTGNCTGPHLHFEVHSASSALNPLSVVHLL